MHSPQTRSTPRPRAQRPCRVPAHVLVARPTSPALTACASARPSCAPLRYAARPVSRPAGPVSLPVRPVSRAQRPRAQRLGNAQMGSSPFQVLHPKLFFFSLYFIYIFFFSSSYWKTLKLYTYYIFFSFFLNTQINLQKFIFFNFLQFYTVKP